MSNKSVANNKKYEITFGYFNENKDMQMEFPPKNAKKYNGLQEWKLLQIIIQRY